MRSIEFMYWLQGSFELSQSPALTPQQLRIVKNHLDMALLVDEKSAHTFCIWLSSYLSTMCQGAISKKQVALVKSRLEHHFDPMVNRALSEKGLL